MARPTRVDVDTTALLHNVQRVKQCAPNKKIIAMVKANAYGCGVNHVMPVLRRHVDALGVACLEEAQTLNALGYTGECVLFQGVFSSDELPLVSSLKLQCVIHQHHQLAWILETPLLNKIKVWVKVDTGMHRLGFQPSDVVSVMNALLDCPWVDHDIGLMTHLACADDPHNARNHQQLQQFYDLSLTGLNPIRSIANSAAIMALPKTHADVVRPGIMLYGVSPFPNKTGNELGLIPVMRFVSAVTAIQHYPPNSPIGYGGCWFSDKPSVIGVVAAGYGDGYPRHIKAGTCVWIKGHFVPIVGRVSMDMLTVDLTDCPGIVVGDGVELWGQHVFVEHVAQSSGTIAYELVCQVSPRARS